jgi:lipopolysaccharide biosynthesis glycosyltransferase
VLNFLYCFDSNYNTQACVSIYSLLENVSEKINIYIIHDKYSDDNNFPEKIKNHPNLENFIITKFKEEFSSFPNLKNAHISQATYFRLFMSKYLPKDIQNIIYLDSDIICFSNFLSSLNLEIKNLESSDYILAANTEFRSGIPNVINVFDELNLKSNKYFNAGVLIINMREWRNQNVEKYLLDILSTKNYFRYWDQDVMNLYFDGSYMEIPDEYNYRVRLIKSNLLDNISQGKSPKPFFIHFCGAVKPWDMRSIILFKDSEIYQRYFRYIGQSFYHVNIKPISLFFKNIFNLFTKSKFNNFHNKKLLFVSILLNLKKQT